MLFKWCRGWIVAIALSSWSPSLARATTAEAITADCQIQGASPQRSSGLTRHRGGAGEIFSSHSSYLIIEGGATDQGDAQTPQLGLHIHSRDTHRHDHDTRWDGLRISAARIEVHLPTRSHELDEDDLAVEFAVGGTTIHRTSVADVDLYDNSERESWSDDPQPYWYEIVIRVDAEKNERFVQGIANWAHDEPMVLTIRSAEQAIATSTFRQEDLYVARVAALNDWARLDSALASGVCAQKPNF